jgi:hypothetical protein
MMRGIFDEVDSLAMTGDGITPLHFAGGFG